MTTPARPNPTPDGLASSERRLDEEEFVGALLLNPEWRDEVRALLHPHHYLDEALSQVYAACLGVQSITTQSLAEHLMRSGISLPPGEPGWVGFLEALKDKALGLSREGLLARADAIRRRDLDRRTRDLFLRMGAAATNGDDLTATRGEFQREAVEIDREAAWGTAGALRIVTASELLRINIPSRRHLLTPVFREKDLVMVYGPRGVAKTWVSIGIAGAIAFGGRFLDWEAEQPRPVLFVDGELPIETIQERIRINAEACNWSPNENLRILPRDLQEPGTMPNLSTPEGQAKVEALLGPAQAIILDNVSTLFTGGDENEALAWESAQSFLLKLRHRGLMAAYIHHAGRSGLPRGTSKREDVLDTILELKHPKDYSPTQGARFELHYKKARGAYGTDVSPLEALLDTDPTTGLPCWIVRGLDASTLEKVVALHGEGLSQKEIADELGKDKGYVSKLVKRARREGLIQ